MTRIPEKPFGKIALTCSGGGYRAGAFHLGAMAYLNRLQYLDKPLLENVKIISTVSGGTITGVVYAMMKQRGLSFSEFYDFLVTKLKTVDLVSEALAKLDKEDGWSTETKRKNLINAFAELYEKHLTTGSRFDIFYEMDNSHLETVVFNTTEFNNGINFRFQNYGLFGNKYYNLSGEKGKSIAGEIRLSDIIAASSCFPGGFEPIGFPGDFIHADSPLLKAFADGEESSVGLMDGGIYDNQGIDGIIRSVDRIGYAQYYDLIIISDVSSPYMEKFQFADEKKEEGQNSKSITGILSSYRKKLRWISIILMLLFLGGALLSFLFLQRNSWVSGAGASLAILSLGLFILYQIVLKNVNKAISKRIMKLVNLVPEYYKDKLSEWNVANYPVSRLESMLMNRVNSLKVLVQDVFMKQIRRQQYENLYANEKLKYRRIANLIRELTEDDYKMKMEREKHIPELADRYPEVLKGDYKKVFGGKIAELVRETAYFGTTLWFTPDDQLNQVMDKLVAHGQLSMCYNLIIYIHELKSATSEGFAEMSPDLKQELEKIYEQCLDDWDKFKINPHFLVPGKNSISV